MKNFLKSLVLWALGLRVGFSSGRKIPVILVIGKDHRWMIRHELESALISKGLRVRGNIPGYSYKLGALLTILDIRSAYSSAFMWLTNLFFSPAPRAADALILEFGFFDAKDTQFIIGKIKPAVIIITDLGLISDSSFANSHELESGLLKLVEEAPNDIFIYASEKLSKLSGKPSVKSFGKTAISAIKLMDYIEDEEGSFASLQLNGLVQKYKSSSYGENYLLGGAIADDIFYNLKKGNNLKQ